MQSYVTSTTTTVTTTVTKTTVTTTTNTKTYAKWSPALKVMAVETWLDKVKRNNLDPTDTKSDELITPTVRNLKALQGASFQPLKRPHLLSWVKKFCEAGCDLNSLKDDKRSSRASAGNQKIPDELKAGIDDFVLKLIASNIELSAPILKPFIFLFIKDLIKASILKCWKVTQ